MSPSPKLSVIMATYNRSTVIRRAIDSILTQTFSDFEFIIIDDSSTDNTPKILLEYASRENSIIILTQEKNQGLAASRNLGVGKAQGKYIAFMDDDDISLPRRLEKQVAFLDNNPKYKACRSALKKVNSVSQLSESDKTLELSHSNKNGKENRKKEKKTSFIPSKKPHSGNIKIRFYLDATAIFTKESFVACGGYRTSDKIIEDLDLTFIFLEKFQVARLTEVLYYYTVPKSNFGNNLSTQSTILFMKRHIACYVSAWYRLTNQTDLVEGDLSLDEIHQLVHQLPPKNRFIIYMTIFYMRTRVQKLNKWSYKEAVRYLMEMSGVTKLPILFYWGVHLFNLKTRLLEQARSKQYKVFIYTIVKVIFFWNVYAEYKKVKIN